MPIAFQNLQATFMSSTSFVPFPSSQIAGAVVVNVFALACTLGLVSVALRVIWLAVRHIFTRNTTVPQESFFFHTQLGNYAACLLFAMTFNSLAGLIGFPWLLLQGITEGNICRAQATIMQIGNWASAYFTVTIAVHTFSSLVLKKRQSVIICRTTIIIGWTIATMIAAVPFVLPHPEGHIYGEDGFACGIRDVYPKHQFLFHLLPIFVASFLSALLYSLIFLVLRGTLRIKGGIKFILDPNERRTSAEGENYHRFIARVARSMIWYPVAYVVFLVPYSVTRLLEISGFAVPSQAIVVASTCWFSLGIADVALLYNTFRVLGPAFTAHSSASTRKDLETVGSFVSPGFDKERFTWDQKSALGEKINESRSFAPLSRSSTADSIQHLLPVLHERNASAQSFYSYSNTPSIGSPITHVLEHRPVVASSKKATQKSPTSRDLTNRVRQESLGLPMPPRPTRSPVSSELDMTERGLFNIDPSMARQLITQTPLVTHFHGSQHAKSTSWPSGDWDTSSLLDSSPISSNSPSQDVYGKPMLGAVALSPPALPNRSVPRRLTLRASRSFQVTRPPMLQTMPNVSPASVRWQRPLLLSQRNSVDSFMYINPRMPPNPPRAYRP